MLHGPRSPRLTHRPAQRMRGAVAPVGLGTLGVAILVAIWWWVASRSQAIQVPSPRAVIDAIGRDFTDIPALTVIQFRKGSIVDDLPYTIFGVLLGVGIGVIAGVGIGVLIARIRLVRAVLQVPLVVLGTIPVVILLPFVTMWFGTSRLAQSGVVIFFTLVTLAFIAQEAASAASGMYEDYARCLGASDRRILAAVVLPAIVPEVLGGVRVALAAGWGLECAAELLGAQHGAGRLIVTFANQSATADMIGVVLCVGVVALACDYAVAVAGRWVVRWQE